jgi:hypothetical protein
MTKMSGMTIPSSFSLFSRQNLTIICRVSPILLCVHGVLFHDAQMIIISICMSITLKELGHFMVDFVNKTFVPLLRTGSAEH